MKYGTDKETELDTARNPIAAEKKKKVLVVCQDVLMAQN